MLAVLTADLGLLLPSFSRVSRLTWHDLLPEEEIWVKLGGDCMKVHPQLCNVPTPNSPKKSFFLLAIPRSSLWAARSRRV